MEPEGITEASKHEGWGVEAAGQGRCSALDAEQQAASSWVASARTAACFVSCKTHQTADSPAGQYDG